MKWLKLKLSDDSDAFVTTKSISSIQVAMRVPATGLRATKITLTDGNTLFIDGKITPIQVLKAIENEQSMDVSSEIIELT